MPHACPTFSVGQGGDFDFFFNSRRDSECHILGGVIPNARAFASGRGMWRGTVSTAREILRFA